MVRLDRPAGLLAALLAGCSGTAAPGPQGPELVGASVPSVSSYDIAATPQGEGGTESVDVATEGSAADVGGATEGETEGEPDPGAQVSAAPSSPGPEPRSPAAEERRCRSARDCVVLEHTCCIYVAVADAHATQVRQRLPHSTCDMVCAEPPNADCIKGLCDLRAP
jgi:hypothetical protein